MSAKWVLKAIKEQEEWIAQCGGNLTGYINRYGSANDPEHSGEGGEKIYDADLNYLHKLQKRASLNIDSNNFLDNNKRKS